MIVVRLERCRSASVLILMIIYTAHMCMIHRIFFIIDLLVNLLMVYDIFFVFFFFSSVRRHTICSRDWSSDVCSSDLFVGKHRVFRFFPPFSFCFLCGRFVRGLQRSPYWKWGRPGAHGWQISQVSSVVTTCVTTVANRRSLRPSAGSPQSVPAASRIHDRQRGSLDDAQEIFIAGDEELGPTGQRRGEHPGGIRIAQREI